ncbi:MAG: AraC family transcriptional regulator, partial [Pseudomonadota bacterium]
MKPVSKLQLPPSQLSGCVFAAICRDTRGAALSDEDRVSYFPASPLVTLTLVRTGRLYMLPTGRDWHD